MKLHALTPNCHLAMFKDGREVLFSYNKAVAGFIPGHGYFVSNVPKGKATIKHVNIYIRDEPVYVPQSQIEDLGEWPPPPPPQPPPQDELVDNPVDIE